MVSFFANSLRVNRALDLGSIDAVGFDLDHTLALYDDAAVNAFAMAEAQALLVLRRGYRESEVAALPQPGDAAAARALALDLTEPHVVKLDAEGRVRVARRAGVWLAPHEIERAHARLVFDRLHFLSSPFDVPTLWLFEAITRAMTGNRDRDANAPAIDSVRACRDARETLDYAHTKGDLKRRLRADLPRFVAPVAGVSERLAAWRQAGKSLFVVTNSDLAYAQEVLDVVVGPQWREIFDVVATSSEKPAFFRSESGRAATSTSFGASKVVEGTNAAALESHLGARGARVLYVGDNARHDVEGAGAYGWKTVHVVAELSQSHAGEDDGWGSPFLIGDAPSWFGRLVRETADVVCDGVDRLLVLDPDHRLEVAAGASSGP